MPRQSSFPVSFSRELFFVGVLGLPLGLSRLHAEDDAKTPTKPKENAQTTKEPTSATPEKGTSKPKKEPLPHNQTKAPGPALSPEEALAKMTVPEGFSVELVASEPDLVNPVAMTIDERGRFWVTESFEYPRKEAGPGRDRVKILEDTDHDGKVDKVTIFAEGLNIPSGIAVGHGGVWVANSPDILFMQDTNGDDVADKTEVVVTGFGRDDTHELPNSLTWGPDGYLYGLNGVFNQSKVKQGGKEFNFTCAMFRIHPRTRTFEIFCEGTSNPWGIAFDGEGSAFISACVIDHLWHLTESGYYHRQGGPYPQFTWKIDSIVSHKHQMAAYCGIQYFDSDAYPEAYRDKLYMGNIHGNCINVDRVERSGATYQGFGEPDFLTANDAWFMPVVQKVGPDGCLYVLDWYDRYHCYQDANRDPDGIDRSKGRLYRVRYKDSPRAIAFDLAKESSPDLIKRLSSPNVFFRDLALRVLSERADPAAADPLEKLVFASDSSEKLRMSALWSIAGAGQVTPPLLRKLMRSENPKLRAWGVRLAGNERTIDSETRKVLETLVNDPSPEVRIQVVIAAGKKKIDAVKAIVAVLAASPDDVLIHQVAWQNLHPYLENDEQFFLSEVKKYDDPKSSIGIAKIMPKATERILAKSRKK